MIRVSLPFRFDEKKNINLNKHGWDTQAAKAAHWML